MLIGKAQPFARGELSAINKRSCSEPVRIGLLGIEGDEQADPRYHGGVDKALHHYPYDHYDHWRANIGEQPILDAPGAFGENVSTSSWTEGDVCIGDRFRLGTALVEISQGRQPCWKQGERLSHPMLPAKMVKSGRSGWYYRVIETGHAQIGDAMMIVERPLPKWTVARVFGLIIAGKHKKDPGAVKALVDMELLHSGWRRRAAQLLSG